ncbi:MAG: hypothetical protein ACKV2U_21535 [Bryobacteraceae bacterium]
MATLSYRLRTALDGASTDFGSYRAAESVRTPAEILAHMGDLMDWALGLADGVHKWHDSVPLAWESEVARFFAAARELDSRLAAGPLVCEEKRLFQGPIADAFTHTGQIALLRRMHGAPVRARNYFKAEI